mmetsp:Transcript_93068/g.221321  ORF Transcript_93068/g.221321 Transcript_93068/m.221321 type:complete len:209 (+) Transcript_93068:253-879(+)
MSNILLHQNLVDRSRWALATQDAIDEIGAGDLTGPICQQVEKSFRLHHVNIQCLQVSHHSGVSEQFVQLLLTEKAILALIHSIENAFELVNVRGLAPESFLHHELGVIVGRFQCLAQENGRDHTDHGKHNEGDIHNIENREHMTDILQHGARIVGPIPCEGHLIHGVYGSVCCTIMLPHPNPLIYVFGLIVDEILQQIAHKQAAGQHT